MSEEEKLDHTSSENRTSMVRPKPLRTLRVTEEGLADYFSEDPSIFKPGPDTYIPLGFTEHGTRENEDLDNLDEVDDFLFPGTGSRGDHVGRNLKGKTQPLRPIEEAGANPYGHRRFLADEFQGMLTFDKKGKPAILSRFPEAKNKLENIEEYVVSIATQPPTWMIDDSQTADELEEMSDEAFNGKSFHEVFDRIDDKMLKQIEKYAEQFEEAFGVKLTVGFDLPDAHLTVTGYTEGDKDLLGFATFPPSVNGWDDLEGLGDHPGYMCLNNQYTESATEKECYDLFAHEFGHTYGLAHPHDLAILNMGKRDALSATKMAYTDLKLQAFQHLITDENGEPILDKKKRPQFHSAGPDEGVLDYGLRKWIGDAPVIDTVQNPNGKGAENDRYKGVFDLEAHMKQSVAAHEDSMVFMMYDLLPMVPMVNDGNHTEMRGSHGDDLLDGNVGYASTVTDPGSNVDQHFMLVEGHMQKILGVAGNNTIIPSQHKDQEIYPGPGKNRIQFLYPEMSGSKRVISEGEGKDLIVFTDKMLDANQFTARAKQGGINLRTRDGAEIFLGGEGEQTIRIISEKGKLLFEQDISDLSPNDLNRQIFKGNAWKQSMIQEKKPKKDPDVPELPPQRPIQEIPPQGLGSGSNPNVGRWTRSLEDERSAEKTAETER